MTIQITVYGVPPRGRSEPKKINKIINIIN